ncbi:Uma2 family endonuclease [Thermodesulfovibrionales bacterium]|nr:Uma2 family endonuclease [Thermodesulfovibrionales bacterium]
MPLAQKAEKKFSYADYLACPGEERWEIIDGEAYNMAPASTFRHQKTAGNFYFLIKNRLTERRCTPGIAPTDVVLSEYDVVQPDVFVVCDEKKITEINIQGSPDLIIEVLSPATALKDKREKKNLYKKYLVKEYIIIDPVAQYAERFLLDEGGLYGEGEIFGPEDILAVASASGIRIPLWEVFEVEPPKEKEQEALSG